MNKKPPTAAITWLFGEEGDVILDAEVQVMIATSGVLVMGTTLLSPLISGLSTVFAVSESRAGWLIVVFVATTTVSIPVMGVLADRIERKRVFVPGVTLFGVAGAALAVVDSFEVALGLRVIQAVGYGSAMPVTIALFGDLYSGDRETTGQGLRTAGINVMIMTIPFLSGLLFSYSWRFPFVLYLLALPIAGWAWVSLPVVEPESQMSLREYVDDLSSHLSDPLMAFLLGSFVARFFLLFGFFTYISVLLTRSLGASVVIAGSIVSIKGIISFLGSTQAGRVASSVRPTFVVLGGFAVGGTGMILMGAIPTMAAVVAGTALFGLGDGVISPNQKSLVNRVTPLETRGGAVSIATTFQSIGKVVGPLVLGALLGFLRPPAAFVLFGGVGGLLGVALLVGVWAMMDVEPS